MYVFREQELFAFKDGQVSVYTVLETKVKGNVLGFAWVNATDFIVVTDQAVEFYQVTLLSIDLGLQLPLLLSRNEVYGNNGIINFIELIESLMA